MSQANSVEFAPQSQKQVRALLAYITEETRAQIDARRASNEYRAAVATVRDIMRAHFTVNPPQRRVKECPWKTLGTYTMCQRIAETYSVPAWDVVGDANPYSQH